LSVCFAVLAALAAPVAAEEAVDLGGLPLRMTAFGINMTGAGARTTETIDITIERWSTEAERDKLLAILVEKGRESLVDAVRDVKPRAGFIRTTKSLGWDIGFARKQELASGGTRIIIVTDRPMSFREAANQPRSADYEFLLADIRINAEGKGQGKLAGAAKITYDKDARSIEIENYGIEPVRLNEVRVISKKKASK
jgi:hypothetical protein